MPFLGDNIMRGWRKKLVFSLIIFFAGFATGVYCAVPVPEDSVGMNGQRSFPESALKSDQFARSFNARMHACLGVAKDTSWRVTRFVKQKLSEKDSQVDS